MFWHGFYLRAMKKKGDFVASRVVKRDRNIGQFGCIIHEISNKVFWTGQAVVSLSFAENLILRLRFSWRVDFLSHTFYMRARQEGDTPPTLRLMHRCYVVLVFQERCLPSLPFVSVTFLPPGILSSIHSCFHLFSFPLTGQLRPEFLCDFLRCWVVFRRTVRAGRWAGWETVIYLVVSPFFYLWL